MWFVVGKYTFFFFFFQAEDGIRDFHVTGVQTCAPPIWELALDIARSLIRPNLQALIDLGAEWIQIDEPGASTEVDELEVFVESFNASVEGLDCFFSTHLCFSDYDLFFPAIEGMSGCRQYCVGFAN